MSVNIMEAGQISPLKAGPEAQGFVRAQRRRRDVKIA
jgi:hypothetical protein